MKNVCGGAFAAFHIFYEESLESYKCFIIVNFLGAIF
jgi:hypothetical protein